MKAEYIQEEELKKIKKKLRGTDYELIIDIISNTGLRVGDVVELKREEVKTDTESYYIEHKAEKTGKLGIWEIPKELGQKLIRRRSVYLFPSYGKSGHITRQAVWRTIKVYAADVLGKTEHISPHSIRKNYAVRILKEYGLEEAQNRLQHSNEELTRYYAYSDIWAGKKTTEPIQWGQLRLIAEYIADLALEKFKEKLIKNINMMSDFTDITRIL